MKSYIKYGIFLFINLLFWRGLYDNIVNKFSNECEMTYMYEYPEYIEVNIEDKIFDYNLFAYGEGRYASQLKNKIFKGIPVLFIPGSQGSSKQVRSLASVALRMAQKYSTTFHFNYFAVDFNEEVGAVFGPLLDRQTKFVELAIKKILSLYEKESNNPRSVILVGHSMGGLVARAVVSLPHFKTSLVSLIITEATPHSRPVVITDTSLKTFTESLDAYWARERYLKLSNVVLVSIGGGRNDFQIPSTLTTSEFADIDETLLSVPLCWLTTDHLGIVWCKQLVLAINRALFNSVDTKTLQLSSDRNYIIRSFKEQLSQKLSSEISTKTVETKIKPFLKKKTDLIELTKLQSIKNFKNTFRSKVFLIPLTFNEEKRVLSIIMNSVSENSFVVSSKIENGNDISQIDYKTFVQHSLRSIPKGRQEVNIDMKSLQISGHTHAIAYVEPTDKQATFALDINEKSSHHARVAAPNFVSSFTPIVIMDRTPENSLSINITIEKFTEYWQSFTLVLLPVGYCATDDGLPIVSFRSSWLDRWEYVMRRKNNTNQFVLGLDVPSPILEQGHVEVHIVKNPSCTYSIRFQKNVGGVFERISLLSVPQMPSFVVSQLLLILASQLNELNEGSYSSLNSKIVQLTPFSVVPLMKISGVLLEKFTSIESDKDYMEEHRTTIGMLPVLLFVASILLTFALTMSLKALVFILSFCARRFLHRSESIDRENTDKVRSLFFNSSFIFAVLILALGISTCGSFGLLFILVFYLVKILKIKCNVREVQVKQTHSMEKSSCSEEHSENQVSTIAEISKLENSKDIKHESKNSESSKDIYSETKDPENSKDITGESKGTESSKDVQSESKGTESSKDVQSESKGTESSKDVQSEPTDSQNSTDSKDIKNESTNSVDSEKNLENISLNCYEIHFTLMLLLLSIFLLNIPSLITWVKNSSFPVRLNPDPFSIPFMVISLSVAMLWEVHTFKIKRFYKILYYIIKMCSISVILFGFVHLYRIGEIVSFVLVVLALHQALEMS